MFQCDETNVLAAQATRHEPNASAKQWVYIYIYIYSWGQADGAGVRNMQVMEKLTAQACGMRR